MALREKRGALFSIIGEDFLGEILLGDLRGEVLAGDLLTTDYYLYEVGPVMT